MRRHALYLALLLPASCAQLLGYSEPSEGSSTGGDDAGIPMSGADGGPPRDSGTGGSGDGAVGPGGQCADLPDFQATVHYGGVVPMAESLAVGDLNRDGHRDVVVVSSSTPQLEIHLGGTNGALGGTISLPFTPVQPCSGGSASVGVGDFDGMGGSDLAYMAGTGCGRLVVRRQDPSMAGKFLAEQQVTAAQGGGDGALTVADLNGDGLDDLVFLSMSSVQAYLARLDTPGAFTNAFTDPISAFVGGKGHGAVVADMNGDGVVDIAWLGSQGVQYKVQSASTRGTFGAVQGFGSSGIMGFATGDLNGDTLTDALVFSNGPAEKFLLNPISKLFVSAGTVSLSVPPENPLLVDVNSDGRLDVTARGQAQLQCDPGPPGTFGSQVQPVEILMSASNVFFLDLTGEGKVDALGLDPSTNSLLVRLQN